MWRLTSGGSSSTPQAGATQQSSTGALNNLLCLPKFLVSHLRSAPPPFFDPAPPPPPPKDDRPVTAPTPTTTPYAWVVPEPAPVLEAFLALIYPRGTFEAPLTSLELTGRVVRAALGYQSAKALQTARERMGMFIDRQSVEVFAMASFFKFSDLVKLASQKAIGIPPSSWGVESRVLMGKRALAGLEELQETRMAGLREILGRSMETDAHTAGCARRGDLEEVWRRKVGEVETGLRPDNDLFELLAIDLRGKHCGDCLVLLGTTIQRCLYEARELPRSV